MDVDFALAVVIRNFTNLLLESIVVPDVNTLFMISLVAGSIMVALIVFSGFR